MKVSGPLKRDVPLGIYVSYALFIWLAILWVFQPQPLWHRIDVLPHWLYGAALYALALGAMLIDFVRRRLKPPPEPPPEIALERYSIANQPTTASQVAAYIWVFWWYFVDHGIAPWLVTVVPPVLQRALYLLMLIAGTMLLCRIPARMKDVRKPLFSREDPSQPSS